MSDEEKSGSSLAAIGDGILAFGVLMIVTGAASYAALSAVLGWTGVAAGLASALIGASLGWLGASNRIVRRIRAGFLAWAPFLSRWK